MTLLQKLGGRQEEDKKRTTLEKIPNEKCLNSSFSITLYHFCTFEEENQSEFQSSHLYKENVNTTSQFRCEA